MINLPKSHDSLGTPESPKFTDSKKLLDLPDLQTFPKLTQFSSISTSTRICRVYRDIVIPLFEQMSVRYIYISLEILVKSIHFSFRSFRMGLLDVSFHHELRWGLAAIRQRREAIHHHTESEHDPSVNIPFFRWSLAAIRRRGEAIHH